MNSPDANSCVLCRDLDLLCSAKDQNKQNIIHKCVLFGNVKLLRIIALVVPSEKYSMLINEADGTKNRYTPLHYACLTINPSIVDSLLLMGANMLLTDSKGNTAFHVIAQIYQEKKNIHAFRISKTLFDSEEGNGVLKVKNNSNETVEHFLHKAEFFEDYICRRSTA